MRRELSAGGVVVRQDGDTWWLAAIRPQGRKRGVWALPKGHIEQGEPAATAAVREAYEETGLRTEVIRRLGESRYTYRWQGEQVRKVVVFFLLRPTGGELGSLPEGMEREVAEVAWIPLAEAARLLSYRGERTVVAGARETLAADAL